MEQSKDIFSELYPDSAIVEGSLTGYGDHLAQILPVGGGTETRTELTVVR